jgi:shikimate 5-dehydrogenase
MLLHQAAGAFAQWTGIMPEVTEELRRKVMEAAR